MNQTLWPVEKHEYIWGHFLSVKREHLLSAGWRFSLALSVGSLRAVCVVTYRPLMETFHHSNVSLSHVWKTDSPWPTLALSAPRLKDRLALFKLTVKT